MQSQRLTARDLQRRYRAGERHFAGVNLSGESLRGMSLKGINLSGADLSHTDLCGTNFAAANLVNTQFVDTKTGTQRRWLILQIVINIFLATFVSLLLGFVWSGIGSQISGSSPESMRGGMISCTLNLIFLSFIYIKGISNASVPALVIFAIALILSGTGFIDGTSGATLIVIIALIGIFSFTLSSASKTELIVALCFTLTGISLIASQNASSLNKLISFIGYSVNVSFCFLIARRIIFGARNDAWIRGLAVWFSSWGGTNFGGSDLTDASFEKAVLKSSHLYQANLSRTNFHLAKEVNLSRFGKTILDDFQVQNLLVTLRGNGQSYVSLNLKGACLAGANLANTDFTEADLSEATLEGAILEQATLTKTQALGTNFHQAILTGATLEAWNIDSTTRLDGVICDHVYLLRNKQERRPSSGDFRPGEFSKLFQEVLNTIDLIFQNGIDWKAFLRAFDKVRVDNNGTELTIQSIENKGDGVVVVRVDVPPNTNKEKIHSEFKQIYEQIRQQLEAQYKQQLNAKDREIQIYEQQSVQMWSVINRLAERPPVSTIENILGNKVVNDQSQNFQGNVSINAQNSVVSLRDISGQVSNQINQLPVNSTLDQPSIKDLLARLQNAIEADKELGEDEKIEALAEVRELANAAQSPKEGAMQKTAKGAMNALKGIAAGLSDASKLASACKELLPLIMTAFGLP